MNRSSSSCSSSRSRVHLAGYGLDRFETQCFASGKSSLKEWIAPHTLNDLSQKRSTSIASIALSSGASSSSVAFITFPPGELLNVLTLSIPPKMKDYKLTKGGVEYDPSRPVVVDPKSSKVTAAATTTAAVRAVVATSTNTTSVKATTSIAKAKKRNTISVPTSSSWQEREEKQTKRRRSEFSQELAAMSAMNDMNTQSVATNLVEVITDVHAVFWEMTFDQANNDVFFSVITPQRCSLLGMADYFQKFPHLDQAFTLPFIKEKLDQNKYRSHEEFVYDFRQMFDNVIIYFPEGSSQSLKAKELKIVFEDKWALSEKLLKF